MHLCNSVQREADRLLSMSIVGRDDVYRLLQYCRRVQPYIVPAVLQTQYLQLYLRGHTVPIEQELIWWATESPHWFHYNIIPTIHQHSPLEIYTDASKTGWGAHLAPHSRHGLFPPPSSPTHTNNWRELHAIRLALAHGFPSVTNTRVIIRTDSRTAASYVNRQGGVVAGLVEEVKRLFMEVVWPRGLAVEAVHVRGVDNKVADRLSRLYD